MTSPYRLRVIQTVITAVTFALSPTESAACPTPTPNPATAEKKAAKAAKEKGGGKAAPCSVTGSVPEKYPPVVDEEVTERISTIGAMDNEVLLAALRALATDSQRSAWRLPVTLDAKPYQRAKVARAVFSPLDTRAWNALTDDQRSGARLAILDWASRAAGVQGTFQLEKDPRVTGAKRVKTSQVDFSTVTASVPGASADGRFAMVIVSEPFDMHGNSTCLLLEKRDGRWIVIYKETTMYI
jgi:hypothetical protein